MRVLLCTALALLVSLPLRAGDAKPNTLTSGETNAGWLLLFDGATPFGWNATGDVRVTDGTLKVGGPKEARVELTTAFGPFDLELEYRLVGQARAWVRPQSGDPALRGLSLLATREPGWHRLAVSVRIDAAGEQTTEYRFSSPSNPGGQKLEDRSKHAGPPARIAFTVDTDGELTLRNIKLRPQGLVHVFNGKDLTGWKEHPGRKSKFGVTKEGWLNVKDGPGDLQTEGQWGDFVLQLECVSNGEHLNSGVFFRCRPNEYQQGYEAQIRNQFTDAATQPYTVEDYDPKTGELTGKRKVMSPAVDFGTGAIYRRQPARLGVAKDGEWFTLTVVAHGRHLATWVNGVQVADWTDHRKLSDNARSGCRLEKGPISIQGHDPTTDLSFRNIRIAELPAAGKK